MRSLHGFTLAALIALMVIFQLPVQAKYHMVLVPNPSDQVLRTMAELGLPMDDAHMIKGQGVEIPLSDSDVALLKSRGIAHRITQPDLEKYYADICRQNLQNIPDQVDTDPVHMKYGSMGGFYNWEQIVADLDSMHLLYPNIAATKVSIGQGWNNNPLWMVKISNSPSANNGKPEGEFDATIHAREPGSYTTLMYAMWWLLENYGTDQEATYLVNNRQLYMVPVFNPDGFRYNQQTNPGGGGMWRKNRRLNSGGSYGVDCNRNFTYMWGYDNYGSSPTQSSETYRGPSAGSEPETQAVMSLITSHNIKVMNNMHTYADVYLCPFGYTVLYPPTPDYQCFMEYMSRATEASNYNFGIVDSPLMYAVNGGSVDWGYHDRNAMAMTVEVGSVGFWPPINYIMPDAAMNLPGLLYLFWVAGARIESNDLAVSDGYLTPGASDNLVATIKNQGQSTSEPFTYELTTTDPYVTITPNVISVDSLGKRATITNSTNPFVVQVSSSCPTGHNVTFNLVIHQGSYVRTQPYTLAAGTPLTLFSDNAESGMSNWTVSGNWNTTTSAYHSATHSFTDSPTGNYGSSATWTMTLSGSVNLAGITNPWMDFWTRWEIEGGYDFAQVEVSTNGGATWTAISGVYTNNGCGQGVQPSGQPGYDGSQYTFLHERMSLNAYAGQSNVKFRFKLRSDGGYNLDGWYVDDIQVLGFTAGAPNLDVVLAPVNPPIVVPANGGSFQFNATVTDNGPNQIPFTVWARDKYPDGSYTATLLGPVSINPPVGQSVTRLRQQNVPSTWPAGVHTYLGYANTSFAYPALDSSSFTWTKSATADGGPTVWDSNCYGELFPGEVAQAGSVASDFNLIGAYPNPFNPTTTISFTLPEASHVTLKVYDVTGQQVAELIDGMRQAGVQKVDFDGSKLASGIYLYTLTAGSHSATGKMVLLK